MHVELTERQKDYVLKYQRILERLADIQVDLKNLEDESSSLITELKELRAKEKEEFPENDSLIENLEADN